MARNLELQLRIQAITEGLDTVRGLIGGLADLGVNTDEAADQVELLGNMLDHLTNQQELIESFRTLKKQTVDNGKALDEARAHAAALGQELANTENPTQAQTKAFEKARKAVNELEAEHQRNTLALQEHRQAMADAGIDTANLGAEHQRVRQALRATEQEITDLTQSLEAQSLAMEQGAQAVADAAQRAGEAAAEAVADAGGSAEEAAAAAERAIEAVTAAGEAAADAVGEAGGSAQDVVTAMTDAATEAAEETRATAQATAQAGQRSNSVLGRLRQGFGSLRSNMLLAGQATLVFDWIADKAGAVIAKVVDLSNRYAELTGKLGQVTESSEELAAAQQAVYDIAQDTRSVMDSTAELYAKVAKAGADLNLTQRETADITRLVNQAFKIAGTDAHAADGAIRQLAQGLASGTLRGDEFNSMMEASPRLMEALAEGLGVAKGELRGMAEQGALTSERIIAALMSQTDTIQSEFEELPKTVDGAVTQIENAFLRYVGQMDQATGASDLFATAVEGSVAVVDAAAEKIAAHIGAVVAVLVASLIPALVASQARLTAWAVSAVSSFQITAGAAGLTAKAMTAVSAALKPLLALAAGFLFGQYLYQQFAVARKAGVALVAALLETGEAIRYAWEVTKAVFTDDTIEDATRRHEERLAELRDNMTQGFIDAGKPLETLAGGVDDLADSEERAINLGLDLAETIKKIGEEFQKTGDKSAALDTLIKTLSDEGAFTNGADGVALLVDGLTRLQEQIGLTDEELTDGLLGTLSGLSGDELRDFQAAAEQAFSQGKLSAEQMAVVLDGVTAASLEKLGQTAKKAGDEAIAVFEGLAREGTAAAADMAGAFQDALSKAATPDQVAELQSLWEEYGRTGKLSADQVADAQLAVQRRLVEIAQQSDSTTKAFQALGLKSAEALALATAEAERNYERLKAGGATTEQLKAAFLAYAEAAVQSATATGQTVDASVEAEAATLGLSTELADLVAKYDEAAKAAAAQAEAHAAEIEKVHELADQLAAEREQRRAAVEAANAQAVANAKARAETAKAAQAADRKAEAEERSERATQRAAAASSFFSKIIQGATNWVARYGEQAVEAFQSVRTTGRMATTSVDELDRRIQHNTETLTKSNYAYAHSSGAIKWANSVWNAALRVEQAVLVETKAARKAVEAVEALGEQSDLSAQDVARLERYARYSTDSFKLLGDSDLSNLESAIERARDRVDELRRSARDAAAQLSDLADSIQANTAQTLRELMAVEERRYQQQLEQIDELADQAGASGAAEARRARQAAREEHQQRIAEIKDRAEEEKRQAEERDEEERRERPAPREREDTRDRQSGASPPVQAGTDLPTRRVILEGPRGDEVTVLVDNDEVEQRLLSVLASGRMVVQ
jgi:tape measure domain-containing protein